jgi:hypothetical protein
MRLYEFTRTILFHGSGYLNKTLQPGFNYTGELVQWDKTESNKFLYLSRDENEAVLNGLCGALSINHDIDQFSFSDDDNILKITTPDSSLTADMVYSSKVWLYRILKTKDIKIVGNDYNGSTTEYKTDKVINYIDVVLVKDPTCGKELKIIYK